MPKVRPPPSPPRASATGSPMRPELVVYPAVGGAADKTFRAHGPGLILMGGKDDVDEAFRWAHRTIMGERKGRGGDVVVLTAQSDNFRDPYIAGLAGFNSVRTIRVGPEATAADLALAAGHVKDAHVLFMGGGNQAVYASWKGSPLQAAIQHVYDQGGVVGGTSAGLAVLGQYVFDARRGSIDPDEAARAPSSSKITFTRDLFEFGPLANTVTETHTAERHRQVRLVAFMARLAQDMKQGVRGVGVDEGVALVVDGKGQAQVLKQPDATGGVHLASVEPGDVRLRPHLDAKARFVTLRDHGAIFDLAAATDAASFSHVRSNGALDAAAAPGRKKR